MIRRAFIAALGGAAAWPVAAWGQQPRTPVIGYLGSGPASLMRASFYQGLKESGYVEGQNVTIEYCWANNHYDRLPELATQLVTHGVSVIAVPPPIAAAFAAKAATQTIPIVFFTAADPISAGLVSSLNRPNGNLTGIAAFDSTLGPKTLELIHELMPKADVVGVLFNPDNPGGNIFLRNSKEAAGALGQRLAIISAKRENEIDEAFDALVQEQVRALLVWPDTFLYAQRERVIARAMSHKIAVASDLREFPVAGALLSYGADSSDLYRRFAVHVGKILHGAKPIDLPIERPTKFDLVLNLKTAKTLGIDVPAVVLARADEVIE